MSFAPTDTGRTGYLLKKGRINTDWKLRYFIQHGAKVPLMTLSHPDPKVSYYLNEEKHDSGAKAYGSILLEQSVVRPCAEDVGKDFCFEIITKDRVYRLPCAEDVGKDFCFEIITKDRVYRLVAQSHEDMLEWIASLVPFTLLHAENEWLKRAEMEIKSASRESGSRFKSEILKRFFAPDPKAIAENFGFDLSGAQLKS